MIQPLYILKHETVIYSCMPYYNDVDIKVMCHATVDIKVYIAKS